MPAEDMADVRAAFARLDEDDVVPGPVGETLADRLTERATEAPSVLEEAVVAPQSTPLPGPAGVPGPAAPVAGVPAPVTPPATPAPSPNTQPPVLPAPDPAASAPADPPRPPAGSTPSAGAPAPAGPDDSAAEPAGEPAWPTEDSPAEPGDPVADGESGSSLPDSSPAAPGEPVADAESGSSLPDGSPAAPGETVGESRDDASAEPGDSPLPADPDDASGETGQTPDDLESSQEPAQHVESATMVAPASKPDGWQVDSYELRAFTDAVERARSYLDSVQAKADRMQGAEMTPQLGTSPVGQQLAKKFDDRLNSADGLRAMLAEAMKRMEDFVTSAEKAARSYEELEASTVDTFTNLQSSSAKNG